MRYVRELLDSVGEDPGDIRLQAGVDVRVPAVCTPLRVGEHPNHEILVTVKKGATGITLKN